jgi:SAM-dependent methyltransferase
MIELAAADFNVLGFDASPDMVHRAHEKFRARLFFYADKSQQKNIFLPKLWCGDMRRIAVREEYDAALCLYDSMNYCHELDSIAAVLYSMADAVRPGGLMIFDVCTEHNCRTHFLNYHERDAIEHYSYTRWSYYQPHERTQINEFLLIDERDGARYREMHRQRIYRIDEVKTLCDTVQWRLMGCYDGFSRRDGDEGSDRVHFVLRRK